jgi:hypothetical protein
MMSSPALKISCLPLLSRTLPLVFLALAGCWRPGYISGTVLDFDTGEPIEGARVREWQSWDIVAGHGPVVSTSGWTNRNGSFRLNYFEVERSVNLQASSKGYSRFECFYEHDRHIVVRLRRRISADPRLPTGFIRLRLTKDGKLYGWNFSEARMTASEDSADIFPTYIDPATSGKLQVKAPGKGGIQFISQDLLKVDNLFLIYTDTAPLGGYHTTAEMRFLSKGGIYFVRTRDGNNFAKIEFNAFSYSGDDITPDVEREVDLKYVYNDRGSRDLRYQDPW